tara:strand:+ start:20723 stop:21058 length:336 start_codon:yes stop_codon:yes gene_type:complete
MSGDHSLYHVFVVIGEFWSNPDNFLLLFRDGVCLTILPDEELQVPQWDHLASALKWKRQRRLSLERCEHLRVCCVLPFDQEGDLDITVVAVSKEQTKATGFCEDAAFRREW